MGLAFGSRDASACIRDRSDGYELPDDTDHRAAGTAHPRRATAHDPPGGAWRCVAAGRSALPISDRTRRLRYLAPRRLSTELVWEEASRMARDITRDHVTLLAVVHAHGRERAVAVAEWVRDRQNATVGEIAIVVCDDEQRQGIGAILLHQLIQSAQQGGLTHLRADMLTENYAMQRLLRGLGLPACHQHELR